MSLTVAEVRHALHTLRTEWYENMSPERPFLISKPAIEFGIAPVNAAQTASVRPTVTVQSKLTIGQFACLFDYGQHLKRHRRLGVSVMRSSMD